MLLFQSKERGETSIVEGKPGCRMGESECMNRSNSEAEHGRRHWVGYASSSTAQHSAAQRSPMVQDLHRERDGGTV